MTFRRILKSIDAITYRMCVSTSKDERDQLMEQVDQYRTDIQTSIDSYEALTQTQEEAAAMETLRENFLPITPRSMTGLQTLFPAGIRTRRDRSATRCWRRPARMWTACSRSWKGIWKRMWTPAWRSRNLYTIIRGQSAASHL